MLLKQPNIIILDSREVEITTIAFAFLCFDQGLRNFWKNDSTGFLEEMGGSANYTRALFFLETTNGN